MLKFPLRMSSVLLQYTVCIGVVIILLGFPIEIECCSMNINDIISLMSENPNYQNDPCYMRWQAEQDAKLTQIWTKQEQMEASLHKYNEYNRRKMTYEAQEQEYRQRNYVSSERTTKKESAGFWKVLGLCVAIMVLACCCMACVAILRDDNDPSTNTATSPPPNENQMSPFVPSNTLFNPTTLPSHTSTNDNNLSNLNVPPLPQGPGVNVPLIRRQDSLPSYEDAVKIPSAPQ